MTPAVITAAQVIAQARDWLGTKYLHQGRSRLGCDCLGFIAGMMSELGSGMPLENLPNNYTRNPQSLLIDTLGRVTRQIPLEPAALILLKFPRTDYPSHAAIYTGSSMIHAYQSVGKVVEHSFANPWTARAVGYYALPLVAYT